MLIKEYRIPLPFTVEEYQRGQLYSVAEMSKNETGGGEGVEVLEQRQFSSSTLRPGKITSGIYTKKIYRLKSKAPLILRKLFPESAFILYEESWNAYPYTKTVVTNPDYMKANFKIIVESFHAPDAGDQYNVLNMNKTDLKKREVIFLDICDESHLKKGDTNDSNNVRDFQSIKTERGPLLPGWQKNCEPLMTSYKAVSVHFKWFGLQNRVEKMIQKNYPRLFIKFHRDMFCWIDRWIDMSMDDIRKFEDETAERLKQQLDDGDIKGMGADSEDSSSE